MNKNRWDLFEERIYKEKDIDNTNIDKDIINDAALPQFLLTKRKIKNKVNNYDHSKSLEIENCNFPYLVTRIRTLIELDELYGVEILKRGTLSPLKLQTETTDNLLCLEVTGKYLHNIDCAILKLKEIMKKGELALSFKSGEVRNVYNGYKNIISCKIEVGIYEIKNNFSIKEIVIFHLKRISEDLSKYRNKNTNFLEMIKFGEYTNEFVILDNLVIRLRGRYSGTIEICLDSESNDPCYLQVLATDLEYFKKGEYICKELIKKIKSEYFNIKNT
ncbi:hypothetical protein CWI37_0582p0020 [Hamiltosporidium tvaerminnensis]|uniref:Uncharacterized protein n=1 Tax=Hamiltosporidium tvaerminnensis TaxID=1176355 RepID=A0A4Q9L466_9MICR|nr:hypothetical protein CWI37_0582p0020 [Hamiltosporidium tvaerminnensis]